MLSTSAQAFSVWGRLPGLYPKVRVGFLQMDRDGVVHRGLYSAAGKLFADGVAVRHPGGEEVIDAFGVGRVLRKADACVASGGLREAFAIELGEFLALGGPAIQSVLV